MHKGILISMGLGACLGAVAVMLLPHNNPTRQLAQQAAQKVEDCAQKVTQRLCCGQQQG